MLPFECFQCGECCSYLGYVHVIKEEYGDYRFLVHNNYTNEDTPVTVDPDKLGLFDDKSIFTALPDACPFFRFQPGTDKAWCTAHLTRPDICRDYGCWRLLILDHKGRRVGRIMNIRTLCSENALLTKIWESCVEEHKEPDDRKWEETMTRILRNAGYTVRR
ncbi:YkgJ family cysteine cluster protein [Methanoregula sp.]|uniref:YkgJ family cysteine cluster protein n=1 Tax=Methanoregula sp. TaxID=2052170 RepID=UPI0031841823